MYTPNALIIATLTILVNLTMAATPPACLLGALQVQSNPADVKGLCSTLQQQMEGNITAKCGSDANAVMSIYSSTCSVAGVQITIPTSTSSSTSGSASSTGSASKATTTGSSGSSGASSGSTGAGGSSTATGSAASASATGKSAASTVCIQTPVLIGSICLGSLFAGMLLL